MPTGSRAEHEDPETVGPANFLAESLLRLLRHGCDVVREIREANQRVHEENNRRRAEARRLAEAQFQEREALILARGKQILDERQARNTRLIVELRDATSVEEMHRVADADISDRDAFDLRVDALFDEAVPSPVAAVVDIALEGPALGLM